MAGEFIEAEILLQSPQNPTVSDRDALVSTGFEYGLEVKFDDERIPGRTLMIVSGRETALREWLGHG